MRNIDEENREEESQEKQPLLLTETQETLIQKAINQTFKSTAHLANLLPTGTVLTFQLLSPIFTNQGHCDHSNQTITTLLLSLCTLSCFLLTFTDSFRDPSGKVRYGVATFRGLWVIDAGPGLPPEMGKSYRMKLIDWVHAFMSVLVFAAVALFDQNVVMCFFPKPSEEAQQLLLCLPVGIGVVCSLFFVAFVGRCVAEACDGVGAR
ncbi:hypothetical protein J5N97_019572 [Dioscorea zingiberensis]|uniref:Uncharacterized protein n=1 Tax=Dioscorea zingiberensis TaxID=325984 RepID=A0A9D5HD00_9LILI|nr:hypothetical protein J5N97_019572 [Dioscorea zingiberensis]